MGRKTPPCSLYPKWTEARFKAFLKSALRSASQRWPPAIEAMTSTRRPYRGSDKRTKWEYPCNHCGGWFKSKDIRKDHIIPVGGFSSNFSSWPADLGEIAARLFCKKEGYQLLCSPCHNKLTQKQRESGELSTKAKCEDTPCTYPTTISCSECKYSNGRKDPEARCNTTQEKS